MNVRIVVSPNLAKVSNRFSSWFFALLLSTGIFHNGNSQSPEALKRKALSEDTEPGERKALLQAAWEMDTSQFEYRYELAMSCIELGFQWEALQHLQFIYSKDEGNIFPDNLYHQARLYQRLGHIEEAQELYEKYLRRHAARGCSTCLKMSRNELEKIKRFKKRKNAENNILLPLDGKLDSISHPKFLSVNHGDHSQQVLIGANHQDLIYRDCDKDCEIQRVPTAYLHQTQPTNETKYPFQYINAFSSRGNVMCSVNPDGVFTMTDTLGTEIGMIPSFPHNMKGFRETMPTLNATQDRLYFASDRPGGFGGMDIWVSRREGNSWLPPENCGHRCNTQGDEVFPVVHSEQLYFSSDGHEGLGGLDIYMWSPKSDKLIQLGEPFSSSADDISLHFFALTNGQKYAAWSSNRPIHDKADACCFYIWQAQLIFQNDSLETPHEIDSMKSISDNLIRKPLKLYFHNDEPDPRSKICETTQNYQSCLSGYLRRKSEYNQATESFSDTALLNDFFDFELNTSLLRMDSLLEEVEQTLQAGMNAALFVRGFTSARASSDYNQCLSERRISAFQNSLETWHEGSLLPYFQKTRKNQLILIRRPLGEDTTHHASGEEIYSHSACLSRRVEVEQLLSGKTELLAPLRIQMELHKDQVSFILVNISDLPLQPFLTQLPENLILEGVKEIPPQQEITVTLRRLTTEKAMAKESFKIQVNRMDHRRAEFAVISENE